MKVKQLIKELNTYDPNEEVVFCFYVDEDTFPDGLFSGWWEARTDEVYLAKYPKGRRHVVVSTDTAALSCRITTNKIWNEYFRKDLEALSETRNEQLAKLSNETLDQYLNER